MNYRQLLLYGALLAVLSIGLGVSAGLYVSGNSPHFFFGKKETNDRTSPEINKKELEGLGYFGGRVSSDRERGVLTYDPEKSAPGKNLYCGDHGYEAFLMDMKGEILHKWQYSFEDAFGHKYKQNPEGLAQLGKDRTHPSWSECYLFDDGSLLVRIENKGLVKIDKNSNLLWGRKIQAHHDFWIEENAIYALVREVTSAGRVSKNKRKKIVEEFIVKLSHNGKVEEKYSLQNMIVDSDYTPLLFRTFVGFKIEKPILRTEDVLHSNSVQILSPGSPLHRKFNNLKGKKLALVSMKAVDSVALFSLDDRTMVWNLGKMSHTQHDARVLANGNLLLYDNWGNHQFQPDREEGFVHEHFSTRILELEPLKQEVVWRYGEKKEQRFFAQCCGRNQRLSNGNTLINHTKKGRAFEVNREGSIVWEFVNPANSVRREGKVASIYLQRIERELQPFWKD